MSGIDGSVQFISHALAGGRTLAKVRDAAGHANVSITCGYLHIAVDKDGIGNLFGFAGTGPVQEVRVQTRTMHRGDLGAKMGRQGAGGPKLPLHHCYPPGESAAEIPQQAPA